MTRDESYDQLEMARDSVLLSNERTLLSYVRTSLALLGAAIVIFRFLSLGEALIFGSATLALAVVIFVWGVRNYRAMQAKINNMTDRHAISQFAKGL